jgi:carbon storage regulator CsrA
MLHKLKRPRGGLVLSRKLGEAIEIETEHGETIVVEVVHIQGTRVRLRTVAPISVEIWRRELPRDRRPAA